MCGQPEMAKLIDAFCNFSLQMQKEKQTQVYHIWDLHLHQNYKTEYWNSCKVYYT